MKKANQGDVIQLSDDDLVAIEAPKNEIEKTGVMYDVANSMMKTARKTMFDILRARHPELDGRNFIINWKRNIVTVGHEIDPPYELA